MFILDLILGLGFLIAVIGIPITILLQVFAIISEVKFFECILNIIFAMFLIYLITLLIKEIKNIGKYVRKDMILKFKNKREK